MSLILEALKKSDEKQRQQQSGNGSALPQSSAQPTVQRSSLWKGLLLLALLGNLVLLGWFILRPAAPPVPPVPAAGSESPAAVAQTTEPIAAPALPSAAVVSAPLPQPAAAVAKPLAVDTKPPATAETGRVATLPPQPEKPAVTAEAVSEPPAVKPLPAPSIATPGVGPTTSEPLPLSQLPGRLRQQLPELKMMLHGYSSDPAAGMVQINGQIYRAGGVISDGLVVDEIIPDGVILRFKGERFVLPRRGR